MKGTLGIGIGIGIGLVALALLGCSVDADDDLVVDLAGDSAGDAVADPNTDVASDSGGDPDGLADADADADADTDTDTESDTDGGADPAPDVAPDGVTDLALDTPLDTATDLGDGGDGVVDVPIVDDADVTDAAGDGDGADPCPPRPRPNTSAPWIVVETGFLEVEETLNCGNVPIILGPQGGAHIWGAFVVGNFDSGAGDYFYTFTFTQNGELVAELPLQSWFPTDCTAGTGRFACAGYRVIVDDLLDPEALLDVAGVLHVRFWREGGIDLESEVVIIPNEVTF